ncbi:MAG: hypothetical protein FWD13_10840, partial [Treponema sp.]|nr:hypothetical protein [Treponema sp.]
MKIKFNGSGFPQAFLLLVLFLWFIPAVWAQEDVQIYSPELTIEGEESPLQAILTEISERLTRRDYASALELFGSMPPEYANSAEIRLMRASVFNAAGRPADARLIANA